MLRSRLQTLAPPPGDLYIDAARTGGESPVGWDFRSRCPDVQDPVKTSPGPVANAQSEKPYNLNENAKVSMDFAKIHVDKLAKLSTRKVAMNPVEDVIRELSVVIYHVGEAIVQQLAEESEKAQSHSKAA